MGMGVIGGTRLHSGLLDSPFDGNLFLLGPTFRVTLGTGQGLLTSGYICADAVSVAANIGIESSFRVLYGTVQATVKIATNVDANHGATFGFYNQADATQRGCIWFVDKDTAAYETYTKDAAATQTAVAGQNFTSDTILKVVWAAGSAKYYSGGVLRDTCVANVPSTPVLMRASAITGVAGDGLQRISVKGGSFVF